MSNSDNDRDRDPANDNDSGKQVTPAPAGGALASLANIHAALANVDTMSVLGRSGLPILLFKREGDGTWMFGQKRTIPEAGSKWAVNPLTFMRGYISFGDAKKVVGEKLLPVSEPMPDFAKLPDTGFQWQEEWAVNLKCLDGADAGVEVTYKANTDGGIKAIAALVNLVRDRLDLAQEQDDKVKPDDKIGDKISPIMELEKSSYPHTQHGRVWIPVLKLVGWMSMRGPAPTPEPSPAPQSPPEQPRRRRVA